MNTFELLSFCMALIIFLTISLVVLICFFCAGVQDCIETYWKEKKQFWSEYEEEEDDDSLEEWQK